MPHYVVSSEAPITIKEVQKPNLPDWEIGGGPILPERPTLPPREEWPDLPTLPPREEWPPLPPFLQPGPGLPIPPSIEHPWVPVLPEGEVDPPEIWPPMPGIPDLPDLSGKTLILARFYVSRHVNYLRWVVIDHEEAKGKLQKALEWVKAHWPAGGIGRPPARPEPGR